MDWSFDRSFESALSSMSHDKASARTLWTHGALASAPCACTTSAPDAAKFVRLPEPASASHSVISKRCLGIHWVRSRIWWLVGWLAWWLAVCWAADVYKRSTWLLLCDSFFPLRPLPPTLLQPHNFFQNLWIYCENNGFLLKNRCLDKIYESLVETMASWFCSKFKHQIRTLINTTIVYKPIPLSPLQQPTISIKIDESIVNTMVFYRKIWDLWQNLWICCENNGLVIL